MKKERKIEKVYQEISDLRAACAEEYRKITHVKLDELSPEPMTKWEPLADQIRLKTKELEELLCDSEVDNRKYMV